MVSLLIAGAGLAVNAENHFEQIKNRNKIRIGTLLTTPPFGQRDDQNNPVGFDIDLANKLANRLGVKLELVPITPGNRIPFLKSKKIDLVVGTFSRTIEREKSVDFSVPYAIAGPVVVVPEDEEEIQDVRDLNDKRVATIPGIVSDIWTRKLAPDATFKEYRDEADQLLALRQGKVDALTQDITIARAYVDKYPDELKIVGQPFYRDYIAIGIPEGSVQLKNWIDWFVFQMHNLGEISELWEKWFPYEEPEMNVSPFF